MSTLGSCRRAIGMSVLSALFTVGCGEHGTAPPLSQEEIPSLVSASSTPDIIVTTTSDAADFGGGQQVSDLPGPDGVVSLREAITAANNTTGPQVIGFNIPASDPGFAGGVFTIRPASELPPLADDGTTIDGATQTSSTGNTNTAGPEVAINGGNNPAGGNGLTIRSANNRVHSLVINGFQAEGCCEGGNGILIEGVAATENVITGCFIGTDASGTVAVPNAMSGIAIAGSATTNQVGGANLAARNVLSGNTGAGVSITAESNLVRGNFIGTDRTGTVGLGNGTGGVGIDIAGDNNTIGGPGAGARNIISGNVGSGVSINGTGRPLGNTVQSNFIGTDVTGTVALGNTQDGVSIVSDDDELGRRESNNNRIIGNLVSANHDNGIGMGGSAPDVGSHNNEMTGNLIGTDINRDPVLGNGTSGVVIGAGTGNRIGGREANEGNVIAGNGDAGVIIGFGASPDVVRNRASGNAIFSNGGLGIDLQNDGVTPNDPDDADVGANDLMNFPVVMSAKTTPGRLIVKGTIDTPNPKSVTLEFFANAVPSPGGDPSGHGEGAVFLGTDRPNAQGEFTGTLPTVTAGTLISATATDADGNTSEFSANIAAQPAAGDDDD